MDDIVKLKCEVDALRQGIYVLLAILSNGNSLTDDDYKKILKLMN